MMGRSSSSATNTRNTPGITRGRRRQNDEFPGLVLDKGVQAAIEYIEKQRALVGEEELQKAILGMAEEIDMRELQAACKRVEAYRQKNPESCPVWLNQDTSVPARGACRCVACSPRKRVEPVGSTGDLRDSSPKS